MRFSIIVPAYNAESTLTETLDAVAAQTSNDWECVVVDDGSTDGTLGIAESFARADSRFRVVSQENQGTGGAYNTGVRTASGEWVALCSADDLLLPSHVATMSMRVEEYGEYDILTCNGYLLFDNGAKRVRYLEGHSSAAHEWMLEDLFEGCFFGVGACYRREMFHALGGYSVHIYGEDYDFWLRALASGRTALYVPDVLSVHRLSSEQKSSNLVRVMTSDIKAISAIVRSYPLTARQRRIARRCIMRRRRFRLWARMPAWIHRLAARVREVCARLRTR